MLLKLITVTFDPKVGTFPDTPLADVPGEIVSVVEHFFTHDGLPHLLLVVHHRPAPAPAPASPREAKASRRRPDTTESLSAEEQARYERLRQWRNSRARADGVPIYLVLSNRQLTELAQRPPSTLKLLQQVKGIGPSKLKAYGNDIIALFAPPKEAPDAG